MNQQIKPRTEADIIKDGLDTFLSVIAERDRLRNENALLQTEVELKRTRITDADRELEATKRELEAASARYARLRNLLGRFVEFLGGAESILSQAIADVPLVPEQAAEQTMRKAIGADIKDSVDGRALPAPAELVKFAEIWGGEMPIGQGDADH